jgi:drug/metabolite transporter (DMT)-like permease
MGLAGARGGVRGRGALPADPGLRAAPASFLAPTSYAQLVWATLSSWLFFADPPDGWTLVGAGVIAAGGVVVAWPAREGRPPRG